MFVVVTSESDAAQKKLKKARACSIFDLPLLGDARRAGCDAPFYPNDRGEESTRRRGDHASGEAKVAVVERSRLSREDSQVPALQMQGLF